MTAYLEWIAAEADPSDPTGNGIASCHELEESAEALPGESSPVEGPPVKVPPVKSSSGKSRTPHVSWQSLPAHNFPGRASTSQSDGPVTAERDPERHPDLWLYRNKTISLLRRYMRWSLEAGRVPSLLGRELFRARISSYTATTFEARVIFLHDVERCLDRLGDFERQLIARAILQEHNHEAVARLLHCTRKTVERRLPAVLDELSDAFLKAELLVRLPETSEQIQ